MQLHHMLEYTVKYNHDSKHNNKFKHKKNKKIKSGYTLIINFRKILHFFIKKLF